MNDRTWITLYQTHTVSIQFCLSINLKKKKNNIPVYWRVPSDECARNTCLSIVVLYRSLLQLISVMVFFLSMNDTVTVTAPAFFSIKYSNIINLASIQNTNRNLYTYIYYSRSNFALQTPFNRARASARWIYCLLNVECVAVVLQLHTTHCIHTKCELWMFEWIWNNSCFSFIALNRCVFFFFNLFFIWLTFLFFFLSPTRIN